MPFVIDTLLNQYLNIMAGSLSIRGHSFRAIFLKLGLFGHRMTFYVGVRSATGTIRKV